MIPELLILGAKTAGIFAPSNSKTTGNTLEGYLQGKTATKYLPKNEDFTIPERYVSEDEVRTKVEEFFCSHGFGIKKPEDKCALHDFHAIKGTKKIRVLITPSPIMSFVTITIVRN